MKQRLFPLLAEAIAAAMAGYLGYQLSTYDVPLLLDVACALALYIAFRESLHQLRQAPHTVTHRCTVPGCAFTVRLTRADAVENRRWQEIAAAHPSHT
ncbi:hypothetical protein ACFXDF_02535 [Streptomyces sp. NPDC059426]|uniref:hypothetical protein n=1 Tax=Streptomyces sp. NPDC059426 TaxID=3346827 RepID=UPI0036B62C0F